MGITFTTEQVAIWQDGNSWLGWIKEIELPEIEWEAVDHEAIGLIGTPQHAIKMNPFECTLTMADYVPDVNSIVADPFTSVNLVLRGSIAEYRGDTKAKDGLLKIGLSGRFLKSSMGSFTAGERPELEAMMTCTRISEVYDGREIRNIDIYAPTYRINGSDRLANLRRNLGMI